MELKLTYLASAILVIHFSFGNCNTANMNITEMQVRMTIFSGRPDPVWIVDRTNQYFNNITESLQCVGNGTQSSHLGYRGFWVVLIYNTTGGSDSRLFIVGEASDRELQRMLLFTAPENLISQSLRQFVNQSISDFICPYSGMTITEMRVSMTIFSGMPDPVWIVDSTNMYFSNVAEILECVGNGTQSSHLGYRGFWVHVTFSTAGGADSRTYIVGETSDRKLQRMLLNTVPDNIISQSLKEIVRKSISNFVCPFGGLTITEMRVSMTIYSGRHDPVWIVYNNNPYFTSIAEALERVGSGTQLSHLGYRGFRVVITFHIAGGSDSRTFIVGEMSDQELQRMLLNTAPDNLVPESLKQNLRKFIDDGQQRL